MLKPPSVRKGLPEKSDKETRRRREGERKGRMKRGGGPFYQRKPPNGQEAPTKMLRFMVHDKVPAGSPGDVPLH